MSNQIDIAKLEAANDLIAEAIDRAGEHSELMLAKALFHLALHKTTIDDLRHSLEVSGADLDD
ncbi:MAG: hypothetical protein H6898_06885 [Rhodobacter sp.]|nr:hypothetical protein [Paracoccaceae bacterium]MCC0076299.1 hypothetical protein [Rhodobacter sp.]